MFRKRKKIVDVHKEVTTISGGEGCRVNNNIRKKVKRKGGLHDRKV